MKFSFRLAAATLGVALVAAVAPTAAATAEVPESTVKFDAGLACAFPLRIDSFGPQTVTKTFTGIPSGKRLRAAGKGSDLLLTNESTGKTVMLKGNGTVQWPESTRTARRPSPPPAHHQHLLPH